MGMRAALVLSCLPFIIVAILNRPFLGVVAFVLTDFVRPQDLTWGFEEVRFALVLSLATLAGYLFARGRFKPLARGSAEPFLIALAIFMALSTVQAAASVEVAWDGNVRVVEL